MAAASKSEAEAVSDAHTLAATLEERARAFLHRRDDSEAVALLEPLRETLRRAVEYPPAGRLPLRTALSERGSSLEALCRLVIASPRDPPAGTAAATLSVDRLQYAVASLAIGLLAEIIVLPGSLGLLRRRAQQLGLWGDFLRQVAADIVWAASAEESVLQGVLRESTGDGRGERLEVCTRWLTGLVLVPDVRAAKRAEEQEAECRAALADLLAQVPTTTTAAAEGKGGGGEAAQRLFAGIVRQIAPNSRSVFLAGKVLEGAAVLKERTYLSDTLLRDGLIRVLRVLVHHIRHPGGSPGIHLLCAIFPVVAWLSHRAPTLVSLRFPMAYLLGAAGAAAGAECTVPVVPLIRAIGRFLPEGTAPRVYLDITVARLAFFYPESVPLALLEAAWAQFTPGEAFMQAPSEHRTAEMRLAELVLSPEGRLAADPAKLCALLDDPWRKSERRAAALARWREQVGGLMRGDLRPTEASARALSAVREAQAHVEVMERENLQRFKDALHKTTVSSGGATGSSGHANRMCANLECGRREDPYDQSARSLKKCAGCGVVLYCSVACQTQDRPRHRKFCKATAAANAKSGAKGAGAGGSS